MYVCMSEKLDKLAVSVEEFRVVSCSEGDYFLEGSDAAICVGFSYSRGAW